MKSKKRKKFALGSGAFGVGNNIYSGEASYKEPKKENFGDWFLENGQMVGSALALGSNFFGTPSFAYGGKVPVEVEGQEVGETPSGQVIDFKGPSHEQGGIDIDLPKGTEIFSKRIKIGGRTMAERKKARESKILSLERLLEKNGNDKLLKDSLKRTAENNEKEEAKDQEIQSMISAVKARIAGNNVQKPGQKMAWGGYAGVDPSVVQQQLQMDGLNLFDWDAFMRGQKQTAGPSQPTASFFGPQNPDGSSGDPSQYFKPRIGEWDPNANYGEGSYNGQIKKGKLVGGSGAETKGGNGLGNLTPGDITGLAGTMYSSFRPMQNTKEQRAGDTPNTNAYEDYGKQGLETMEDAKGYIGGQRDKALNDIESARARITASGRNSARGVNSMRALDLAANANANSAEGDVYDNFSKQMMQLLSQQAGFENAQDSAVMGGEQARDLADRQDRDQYYSNLAQDISSKGQGIQTMGKMLNQNKRNTVAETAVNNSSSNYMFNSKGELTDKNGTPIDPVKLAKLQKEADEANFETLAEYLASKK